MLPESDLPVLRFALLQSIVVKRQVVLCFQGLVRGVGTHSFFVSVLSKDESGKFDKEAG